ncbi:MAG TPA: hypothetical protein VKA85_03975 [Candidatus Limnocylindrales bacterium]|nr:hypothetical protein [Candidatus Limnocylindrales bacterium]
MAELIRTDWTTIRHHRRATDRAAERMSRASDRGDATALRIASSQYDVLMRQRADHRAAAIVVHAVEASEAA